MRYWLVVAQGIGPISTYSSSQAGIAMGLAPCHGPGHGMAMAMPGPWAWAWLGTCVNMKLGSKKGNL